MTPHLESNEGKLITTLLRRKVQPTPPPPPLFPSEYTADSTMVLLLRWPLTYSINESEPKARQTVKRERSKLPVEEGYYPNCGQTKSEVINIKERAPPLFHLLPSDDDIARVLGLKKKERV